MYHFQVKTVASSTAINPVRKIPSKVPARPMEATGAPSLEFFFKFRRSAPNKVPHVPEM